MCHLERARKLLHRRMIVSLATDTLLERGRGVEPDRHRPVG